MTSEMISEKTSEMISEMTSEMISEMISEISDGHPLIMGHY